MRTLILILFLVFHVISAQVVYKRLSGPPEEFRDIPNPIDNPTIDYSVISDQNFVLVNSSKKYKSSLCLDVQNDITYKSVTLINVDVFLFSFTVISNIYNQIKVEVLNPNMDPVDTEISVENYFFGPDSSAPCLYVNVFNGELGNFTVILTALNVSSDNLEVTLFWQTNPVLVIKSYLSSYLIAKDSHINISALMEINPNVTSKSARYFQEIPTNINIFTSILCITEPDGNEIEVEMNNEGISGDLVAGDNTYGASFQATIPGNYLFSPQFTGSYNIFDSRTQAEQEFFFQKMSNHLIPVSASKVKILRKVDVKRVSKDILNLIMHVINFNPNITMFDVYTEIYGHDYLGILIPVGWLGGIYEIINNTITLEFNIKWVKRVNVCKGLVLKGTVLTDTSNSFPTAKYTRSNSTNFSKKEFQDYIKFDDDLALELCNSEWNISITREMREGQGYNKKRQVGKGFGLIMLPGYCASINPWLATSFIWTNAFYFTQYNLALSNFDYTFKVYEFVRDLHLESCSIIAHSQGGMIAVTLKNYYVTCLDNNPSIPGGRDRLIQTLGTPWMGTPLAGDPAKFGQNFNFGCGPVPDLTPDGAINWKTNIRNQTISEVHYYTTTYSESVDNFDFCNVVTELLLDRVNDGTVELAKAGLEPIEFSQYEGDTTKECHTTGMKFSAGYLNPDRAIIMNDTARRNIPT
jgi:hypothetical protein